MFEHAPVHVSYVDTQTLCLCVCAGMYTCAYRVSYVDTHGMVTSNSKAFIHDFVCVHARILRTYR